ncbi:MAG: NfeD family protein [Gaiella sp.]
MEGATGLAVWLVVALVLVGVEIATLAFIALYLAVGAVAAAVVAIAGANVGVQVAVMAVVSIASLLLTRKPLMRALNRNPVVPSNAPTVVGKRAVITVPIHAGPGQRGQVRIGTEYWSATSSDESSIDVGVTVDVMSLLGVSVVVRPSGGV